MNDINSERAGPSASLTWYGQAGFRLAAQHELFVKLLAVRVREPRLVTANVVGG